MLRLKNFTNLSISSRKEANMSDIFHNYFFIILISFTGNIFVTYSAMHSMKQLGTNQSRPFWIRIAVFLAFGILVFCTSNHPFLSPISISLLPFIGRILYHNGNRNFKYYVCLCIVFLISDIILNILFQFAVSKGILSFTEPVYSTLFHVFFIRFHELLLIKITSFMLRCRRNNNLEQELKFQTEHLKSMEAKYHDSQKTLFDIRDHMQNLQHLYRSTPKKQASSYTAEINTMLHMLGETCHTNCNVLNIVLNDKTKEMQELDISFTTYFDEFSLDFIKQSDIIMIFTNLLDNAIEATKQAKTKQIELRIEHFREFLRIHIRNTHMGNILEVENELRSTKKNHEGNGIKNVKRTLDIYHGDLQYKYSNTEFSVYITLPIDRKKGFSKRDNLPFLLLALSAILPVFGRHGAELNDAFDEYIVTIKAKNIVNLLNTRDFDTILDRIVREDLVNNFLECNLEHTIEKIHENAGKFVKFISVDVIGQKDDEADCDWAVAIVLAQYESKKVRFTISFDSDMNLIGLYMK